MAAMNIAAIVSKSRTLHSLRDVIPGLVRASREVSRVRRRTGDDRAVWRAAQEFREAGVVIQEALHPRHAVTTETAAIVARIVRT